MSHRPTHLHPPTPGHTARRALIGAAVAGALAIGQFAVLAATGATPPAAASSAGATLIDQMTKPASKAADAQPYSDSQVVSVIVDLTAPSVMDQPALMAGYSDGKSAVSSTQAKAFRDKEADGQAKVEAAVAKLYPKAEFRYSYTNVLNGFAARIPFGLISKVKALPGVADVYLSESYQVPESADQTDSADVVTGDGQALGPSGPVNQTGADQAWAAGFTGAGKVAAIFDSGIWDEHEAFSYMDPSITAAHPGNYKSKQDIENILDANPEMNLFTSSWSTWFHSDIQTPGFSSEVQQEFLDGDFWTSEKLPFQADYNQGDTDAVSHPSLPYYSTHGTHVSGIVAGNTGNGKFTGIAKDAQIFFFKIFDDYDPFGQETDESVFAALDDAVTLGVNAFNLSLGIGNGNSTANTYAQAGYQKAYNRAQAAGISVAVSAGNDYRDNYYGGQLPGMSLATTKPNAGTVGFSGSLYGPMTVASNNATGYDMQYTSSGSTDLVFSTPTAGGDAPATIYGQLAQYDSDATTNPDWQKGLMSVLPGTYPLVDVKTGSDADIQAATGQTDITGQLAGKIAVVSTTISDVATMPFSKDVETALIKSGASAVIVYRSNSSSAAYPDNRAAYSDPTMRTLPVIATLGRTQGQAITAALAENPVSVRFDHSTTDLYFANGDTAGVPATSQFNVPDTQYFATGQKIGATLTGTYDVAAVSPADVYSVAPGSLTGKVVLAPVTAGAGEAVFTAADVSALDASGAVAVIGYEVSSSGAGAGAVPVTDPALLSGLTVPYIGQIAGTAAAVTLLADGEPITVSFKDHVYATRASSSTSPGMPSGFSSWGDPESLDLKPDIMAPGGTVWSSVAGDEVQNADGTYTLTGTNSYSTMSGTSMASPDMEGSFLLIQQIVDQKIQNGTFREGVGAYDGTTGSQAYSNLVNQLAASTATPLKPMTGTTQNRYFSPRKQGAGEVNIGQALKSDVILRNLVTYNPATGQAPRTKVELGDKVNPEDGTIQFALDNFGPTAVDYDVSGVLQTDATTTSGGKTSLTSGTSTTGADTDPIESAQITLDSVTNGALITGGQSNNVNKYASGSAPAQIEVPAGTSTTVTLKFTMANSDVANYNTLFPNGWFLDGFVFFDGTQNSDNNVSIPVNGFVGDWNKAPIFDTYNAYQDISSKQITDTDYPEYWISSLATLSKGAEAPLGVNQFTGDPWPGFKVENEAQPVRDYFQTARDGGSMNGDWSAISPNGDGQYDIAYANLALERNAKAISVVIKDAAGNIVKTLGPEYEYFEERNNDGNETQQIAATYGTKYKRDMAWDGTDSTGAKVPDGQYTYEVRAVVEKSFLEDLGYNASKSAIAAYLDAASPAAPVQSTDFQLKVDTTAPTVTLGTLGTDNRIDVSATDDTGIQAIAYYYDGAEVGTPMLVNSGTYSAAVDLTNLVSAGNFDISKFQVQAVDYAGNTGVGGARSDLVALFSLYTQVAGQEAGYTASSWAPVKAALDAAAAVLPSTGSGEIPSAQAVGDAYRALLEAYSNVVKRGDTTALAAAVASAQQGYQDGSAYTAASWKAYQDALTAAQALLASTDVSQPDVDSCTQALEDAIDGLIDYQPATVTATATVTAPAPTVTETVPGPTSTVTATETATATVTAPAPTVTETVPGPTSTVTMPAPTVTVTLPAPTVTETVPGPTSTVTATSTATVTSPAPGPTQTVTLPAATKTATVQVPGPTTTATVRVAAPQPTATATVTLTPSQVQALERALKTLQSARPTIKGVHRAGRTLKAILGSDKWTAGTKISYRWYNGGKAIKNAKAKTYKVKRSDRGDRIIVKVTGSKTGYTTVVRASKSVKIHK
ncbi:MAG: S8 family serine peptidase [Bifidobacteriaceae bacterium]|jgi:hypothetical protein|nr:S8 family serine peptidase [Bifidobacteriaceae bacterium]